MKPLGRLGVPRTALMQSVVAGVARTRNDYRCADGLKLKSRSSECVAGRSSTSSAKEASNASVHSTTNAVSDDAAAFTSHLVTKLTSCWRRRICSKRSRRRSDTKR